MSRNVKFFNLLKNAKARHDGYSIVDVVTVSR